MQKYKVGDYLISKDSKLYRIIDSYTDNTGTLYDIRGLEIMEGGLENIKCLNNQNIEDMGVVISEEKMSKLINLLFLK